VDDAAAELLDAADRVGEVIDLEVGKGEGVTGTQATGVDAYRGAGLRHRRLPALALTGTTPLRLAA